MASFPVGFLVAAPLLGAYLEHLGRKNVVSCGVILMATSTLTFGCASLLKDRVWSFYIISVLARLLQGLADASVNITVPSIIAIEFQDN
jgi:MFS family permease